MLLGLHSLQATNDDQNLFFKKRNYGFLSTNFRFQTFRFTTHNLNELMIWISIFIDIGSWKFLNVFKLKKNKSTQNKSNKH